VLDNIALETLPSAVPGPSPLVLLGIGLLGMLAYSVVPLAGEVGTLHTTGGERISTIVHRDLSGPGPPSCPPAMLRCASVPSAPERKGAGELS
jgi:hypothetical protein